MDSIYDVIMDGITDDELVQLANETEASYRNEENLHVSTARDINAPMEVDNTTVDAGENRIWSQNAQDWLDDADLEIPALNEVTNVQYGEGRRALEKKPLFEVIRQSVETYKKFETTGTCYHLRIADPDPKVVPEKWIKELLEGIISYFKNNSRINVNHGDRIGMSLKNSLCGTEPIYISLRRADQLAADVILTHVMNIFDSNKSFFLNGHLTIHFDHIQMPHGSGDRIVREIGQTNIDFIDKKACYLKYKNPAKRYQDDEYCLPYALVLGRAFSQFKNGEKKRSFYKKYQESFNTLRKEAEKLCREAGVDISQLKGGCSFDEVKKFQRILPNYQIVIFGRESIKPMYTDERYNEKIKLNIMLHKNHYSAMRSLKACFGASYICSDCYVHVNAARDHSCKYTCLLCNTKPKCKPIKATIVCKKCNRYFYGQECFKNHLKVIGKNGKNSLCQLKKNCPKCKSNLDKGHMCGKRRCFICEKMVDKNNHLCHMPQYASRRQDNHNYLYVMYDFETQQNSLLNSHETNKFKHVPNLCVSQSQCSSCINITDISINCKDCGVREYIYHSTNCVVNLMDYLVEKAKETKEVVDVVERKTKTVSKFNKIILIAHNSAGYDAQFILKYIYDSDRFSNPGIIMNGTKIIQITIGDRIKFIDSLIYFQKPLSDLPKLFGFEEGKGYYPHYFSVPENDNYIGKLPEKKFYGYDSMKPEQRAKFEKWYDSMPSDYVFDNKKELTEYCRMDVTILRKACMKFMTDFWEKNKIDPFLDGCTIAGVCNKVFRSKYLEADTIGVLPPNGYRLADNQSKIALKWLVSIELEQKIEIQHAGRGREYTILGVGRCDGYSAATRTVFEFHGCYWHSCSVCYPGVYHQGWSEEMRKRTEATLRKEKAIIEAGYNLVVKRECDFRREMEEKQDLNTLLNNHPIVACEPLNPRDAFYGGRTNANKLYFKADAETKALYADVTSLYPFVNKTTKCPKSHPKIYVGDECLKLPWQELDGLMKVTVAPPRELAFPVLPSRHHKRLMFVLCNTCAENLKQSKCTHNEAQRQFTGTYVMDEVKLAVSKGYKIIKIHEIWSYEVTQYDPKTGKGGFFSSYINNFLKLKQEASNWPKWCKTDEQKDKFIKDFYDRENILLDKNKIEKNEPLRSMSKLMLNSFWGRFGMRPDLPRTIVVESAESLMDLILRPSIEVHSILGINDEKMLVNYRIKEEAREANSSTNVIIASFTTAYARMELYKYLELLGPDRVLYFDTDSVLFTYKEGEVLPEFGDFLGQLTDELADFGPSSYIIEFISGGPKNYAFRVYSPTTNKISTVVKVKGITLNYTNSQLLDFDKMKSMVTDPKSEPLKLSNDGIRRTNFAEIYSTTGEKTYRINFTKRQLNTDDYSTVPYGY